MTTIINAALFVALALAAVLIVALILALRAAKEAEADQRDRADILGMAVVECHRTIGELEQTIAILERGQQGILRRAIVIAPTYKGPSGESICLN